MFWPQRGHMFSISGICDLLSGNLENLAQLQTSGLFSTLMSIGGYPNDHRLLQDGVDRFARLVRDASLDKAEMEKQLRELKAGGTSSQREALTARQEVARLQKELGEAKGEVISQIITNPLLNESIRFKTVWRSSFLKGAERDQKNSSEGERKKNNVIRGYIRK